MLSNDQANPTIDDVTGPSSWQEISSGVDGQLLVGQDERTGVWFQLKVLSPLQGDAKRLAELASRLRLIRLANHPGIRHLARQELNADPPTITQSLPKGVDTETSRLAKVVGQAGPRARIHIAASLVDIVASAHRVGLAHGGLTESSVLIVNQDSETPCCNIDFTATACDSVAVEFDDSIDHDLSCLAALLANLLGDLLGASPDDADVGRLAERIDEPMKRILSGGQEPSDEFISTAEWQHALAPWRTRVDETRSSAVSVSSAATMAETAEFVTAAMSPTLDGTGSDDASFMVAPNAAPTPVATRSLPVLGRFRLLSKIGAGGMGTVFRGLDMADDSPVAIKVLKIAGKDGATAIRRFRKEARLLGDVQNDYVTKLVEVGDEGGHHFLAMEFVDGIDLRRWLAARETIDEETSLRIASDLARALTDAHARGIVHRDIKPENVLLKYTQAREPDDDLRDEPYERFQLKLTDFGLARHVHQTISMEVTQVGTLLGTPRYMSPEQCKSGDIGPPTDVYAIGITLYEMLAGESPFDAEDPMKLVAMHCYDPPPSIQKRRPEISDATAGIVARCLAKSSADRYHDADQLLAELESVLRGEPADIEAHPKSPNDDSNRIWEKAVSWELDSKAAELWPLVSNTERINHAVGLPSVEYRTVKDPQIGIRKFGTFRLGGVPITWEEHPFEWIEGSRMGILREFETGPFKWFMSIVSLQPLGSGGTRLTHHVRIEPRNVLGRVLTTIEADWKGFKNLTKVYRRIDRSIQGRLASGEGSDAYEGQPRLTRNQLSRLEQRLGEVIESGIDPNLAAVLSKLLRQRSCQELSQLRPLAIAEEYGVDGQAMVDACLVAAAHGLLSLRWDVLCPSCRAPAMTSDMLSEVEAHTHCEACDVDFKSNLGDAIEMVFQAHSEIRDVDTGSYCIGGPEHAPHVIAQLRIDAGERLGVDLDLKPGEYLIRGPRLAKNQRLHVRDAGAPSHYAQVLSGLGSGHHTPQLRGGRQQITLTNDLPNLHVVRIERMIPRNDVITAAAASTIPKFRELFPHQTFASTNPIVSEQLTLMATAVNNAESLYQSKGDADGYHLILTHHEQMAEIVGANGGTVAKTVGDVMLAAFDRCESAVRAALEIQHGMPAEMMKELEIGIGVHCGSTLVTTQNRQLDYFGATVRAVMSLPQHAGTDLLLTEPVYCDPAMTSVLRDHRPSSIESIKLPGSAEQRVHRICK